MLSVRSVVSEVKKYFLFCLIACCIAAILWPQTSSAVSAKGKYYKADACYGKLKRSPKKQKYRDQWLQCIKKFEAVYRHDPSGPWAAAGLYRSGELYQELYKRSSKASDNKAALDIFARIIKRYPKSRYRPKAEDAIGGYPRTPSQKTATQKKTGKNLDIKAPVDEVVKKDHKKNGKKGVTVKGLRFWSNPSYTRVVIDADRVALYTHRLLKKDVSIQKPQRLYIDLNNSRLGEDIKKIIPINDNLLSDIRAGQQTPGSVRVVVDIKSFKTYKVFSLQNPFRIVIDVWGRVAKRARPKVKTGDKHTKISPSALAKQLSLGVRRIVIDPGHGGRDFGAPGYLKGVHEKKVVLQIARRLAKKIRKELGYEVFMTRNSDRNLTLEERTAIANTKNADLFISIHTNAARNRKAIGIETFFLNLATDDDAILVAARENATSKKNISDLQSILSDLMQNAKINESSRLAAHVQKSMYNHLRKKYSRIKSKGVKQAPFYVLLGAHMPAILIETAFISNSRECKRLINSKYQDRLADAIIAGIRKYVKETKV